jgi:hypothetical protein
VKYERSPVEQAAVDRFCERRKHHPTPAMRIKTDDGVAMISADHPDAYVGGILAMQSIGTTNGEFYKGVISQLVAICPSGPSGAVETDTLNFALSLLQGVGPKDQVEGMLAAQMCAVHMATMVAARRLAKVQTLEQQDSAARMFNQLSRTFVALVEG